jgi:anti-anti-sigma regulatory factor
MLKITALETAERRTLVLEGKLVDPWLTELERMWAETRGEDSSRSVLIDMKDVTDISSRGEDLLRQMITDGAKLNCCRGVLTRHVVKRLVNGFAALTRKSGNKNGCGGCKN